jgi:hypothetical protein
VVEVEAVAMEVEDTQMGTIILTVIIPAAMTIPAAIPTGMTTLGLLAACLACAFDAFELYNEIHHFGITHARTKNALTLLKSSRCKQRLL